MERLYFYLPLIFILMFTVIFGPVIYVTYEDNKNTIVFQKQIKEIQIKEGDKVIKVDNTIPGAIIGGAGGYLLGGKDNKLSSTIAGTVGGGAVGNMISTDSTVTEKHYLITTEDNVTFICDEYFYCGTTDNRQYRKRFSLDLEAKSIVVEQYNK